MAEAFNLDDGGEGGEERKEGKEGKSDELEGATTPTDGAAEGIASGVDGADGGGAGAGAGEGENKEGQTGEGAATGGAATDKSAGGAGGAGGADGAGDGDAAAVEGEVAGGGDKGESEGGDVAKQMKGNLEKNNRVRNAPFRRDKRMDYHKSCHASIRRGRGQSVADLINGFHKHHETTSPSTKRKPDCGPGYAYTPHPTV